MNWYEELDGPAKKIAESDQTPIRVLAGPGTGKTFALKRRVARLLQDGTHADRILVSTFTRMAAQDLKSELSDMCIQDVENVCCGTLHAFCFSLLGQHDVFKITGRTPRPLLAFEERILLNDMDNRDYGGIQKLKERLNAFNAAWARLQSQEPGWPTDDLDLSFQKDLNAWLKFHEAMLIGELIPESLKYLQENPASPHRRVFQHVLIDEYQDLNRAEQKLLDLLADNAQLCIIGDEDQSIYSFKFAYPNGIATFHESHSGTYDIYLEECRRCPKDVVELANTLINNNEHRAPRQLMSRPENPDGKVHILQWNSMQEEARGIADIIKSQVDRNVVTPGQVLILAPCRHFGHAIRDELRHKNIHAHSFFNEEELEDKKAQRAFTLLTLLANPDDRVALRSWCGSTSPTLNRRGWNQLRNYCGQTGKTPRVALEQLESGDLTLSFTGCLITQFRELQSRLNELDSYHGQDLIDYLFPISEDWAKRLHKLASKIVGNDLDANALHDGLRNQISQPDLPTDADYVRIMTLHKSKGLTADLVVVVGCIEGLIPSQPPQGCTLNEDNDFLEEQRRLFYVGITRARQSLFLSSVTMLPLDQALRMRARVNGNTSSYVSTIASTFLNELGPTRPEPRSGETFLQSRL